MNLKTENLTQLNGSENPKATAGAGSVVPPGLFRAENVTVADGELQVTVGTLDSTVSRKGRTFSYQGGIVRSVNPGQVGWYYETKMKANATVMSSTFWLMSRYDCQKKLELDIQETVGRTTEQTADWAKDWDQPAWLHMVIKTYDWNPVPEDGDW